MRGSPACYHGASTPVSEVTEVKNLSLVALLVTLSACKSDKLEGEAIHAKVVLAPAVSASCVLFEVRNPSDHSVLDKRWLPRKNELQVAIFKGPLPQEVELAARPYQGGDCSNGQEAKTPNGAYVTVTAAFVAGQVTQANELDLQPGQDADNDTYVDSGSGGGDCNDSSGAVNPGITEACTDQVDLNCDGKRGCEASTCGPTACIGPPAALALTLPTGSVPAGTCTSGTVQVKDSNGSSTRVAAATSVSLQAAPTGGIAFFSNSNCTSAVTSVSISANEGTAGFFIMGQLAGTVTVTASASGLTTASQNVQVTPGPGNRLSFTSPARTVAAGNCSQVVTVQSQDAQGNAANVSAATTISLAGSLGAGFQFFANSGCTGTAVSSVAMSTGTSSVSFYFKATKAGNADITATAPSFTGSSQTQTINPGPPAAIIFTGPSSALAGDCSTPVTVTLQDAQGNPTTAATNTTIALSATGKPLVFSTNACSTTTATSVVIAQGAGSATFSFKGTQAGASTITGTNGSLTSATLNVTINAGPPSVLVFTTGPQTLVAGACSAVTTVQLQDGFGNPAKVTSATAVNLSSSASTGFAFFASAGCSGGPVTGVNMPAGTSDASFYFQGTSSGTVTLTASVGAITKTQSETINPGSPTVQVLSTASQTVTAGTCMQINLQVRDNNGNASPVSGNQTASLSANPTTGFTFYSNSGCSTSTTSVTVSSGQSSASFYAKPTKAGSVTVTATTTGLTDGTLSLTVNAAAPNKVSFLSTPQTIDVGACSGITTVEMQDTYGNSTPGASSTTINLSGSTGTITFYTDSTCTSATTSVSAPASQSTASFYFKDSAVESVTITAASTGLTNGTQSETINPLAPTALVFTTGAQSVPAGTCSAKVTVQAQAGALPTTVLNPLTVNLAASPATGFTFYTNSNCSTATAQVTIPTGQGSVDFYFKGTAAGTVGLTGSSGSLTSATQNATITALGATKVVFSSSPYSTVAGVCSAMVTIQSADTYGNASAVGANKTVNLTDSGTVSDGSFAFYSDSNCGTPITSVVILSGQTTANFYYKGPKARTVTLTAGGGGLSNGTQDHTIIPGSATSLVFTTSAQPLLAGTCAVATVASRDAFGNPAADALTVNLSGSTLTEFFTDSGCTTSTNSVSISAGNSSANFYFKGYVGGINATAPLTLTAASGSLTPATQDETITPTVRTGTCSMGNTVKSVNCTIAPALADTTKAFLVFQSTSLNTDSSTANVRCRLSSTTQVICERGAGTNSVNIRWSVAEFPSGVTTQNLAPNCGADTTQVSFSSVVMAESFLLLSSERNVNGEGSTVSRLAELMTSTQAEIRKTIGSGCGGSDANDLMVVDYPGASVQRALTSMPSGSAIVQLNLASSVALNRSVLLYSYFHDSTTTKICDRLVRGELTSSGAKVTFSRGDGDSSSNCTTPNITSISYEVVQFPVGTVVQQITQSLAAGATSTNISLPTTVDPTRTIVIAGGQWASGQVHGESSYSGGSVISEGRAQASISTDGTTLTLTRETSNASATFTVYVVQLKP